MSTNMQRKFIAVGNDYRIVTLNGDTALDALPPQVYTVQHDPLSGYYLTVSSKDLTVPSKIYGRVALRAAKILETYRDRSRSTGVLLTGDKGTGKTLLMSILCNMVMRELELPIILIKQGHAGEQFNSFIENIGEAVIVFDEFAKMYTRANRYSHHDEEVGGSSHGQDALLSLFDGLDKTKRLILVSENDRYDISEFMLNRPSRIYYHYQYSKLDEDSIHGYCEDHEISDAVRKDIIDVSRKSSVFSFDMLQSIVEEHNRYRQPVSDIIDELNIEIRQSFGVSLKVLKVVSKIDHQERKLVDQDAVISKPGTTHGYGDSRVVFWDKQNPEEHEVEAGEDDMIESAQKILNEINEQSSSSVRTKREQEKKQKKSVYLGVEDIVYEEDGKVVFETDWFIITAKQIESIRYSSYSSFF